MTIEKIKSKIVIDQSGCWVWQGEINRKRVMSHRVTYELFVGEIPEGYVVDHLCKTRSCCNPEHLEAVTPRENTIRGDAVLFKRLT